MEEMNYTLFKIVVVTVLVLDSGLKRHNETMFPHRSVYHITPHYLKYLKITRCMMRDARDAWDPIQQETRNRSTLQREDVLIVDVKQIFEEVISFSNSSDVGCCSF